MIMNVVPFNFNTHEIRTVTPEDGEPWFIAKDVATALGYSNPRKAVTDHCKRAETLGIFTRGNVSLPLLDSQTKIIPESDVYRLTMRSKLEGAEAFQDWIVEEVLPSIRKTGSYSLNAPKTAAHEVQNSIAELAMKALNLSESGKIEVLQRLCASNGVDSSFLPKYSESEDNRPAKAVTHLLKENNLPISSVKYNNLAIKKGYLEIATRPSSSDKEKEFKRITDLGLKFGKNVPNPKNERETSPLWYVDTFMDIYGLINS